MKARERERSSVCERERKRKREKNIMGEMAKGNLQSCHAS
jgi:hypothetical protein